MRFWDASALVPLLIGEPTTPQLEELFRADPQVTVWWATELECVSAIARREREQLLDPPAASAALQRLDALRDGWQEVDPGDGIRRVARRLLRSHAPRAADAAQLAAALAVAENEPRTFAFVSLDERLAAAGRLEGLDVLEL